jgi:hypothetical protein
LVEIVWRIDVFKIWWRIFYRSVDGFFAFLFPNQLLISHDLGFKCGMEFLWREIVNKDNRFFVKNRINKSMLLNFRQHLFIFGLYYKSLIDGAIVQDNIKTLEAFIIWKYLIYMLFYKTKWFSRYVLRYTYNYFYSSKHLQCVWNFFRRLHEDKKSV